jgi:hypothetical protein
MGLGQDQGPRAMLHAMVDPTSAIATAKAATTGVKLGKAVWDKAKGISSYGRASAAIEELKAEAAAEQEREAIAKAVVEELTEVVTQHDWGSEPEEERPSEHDLESAAVDLVREGRRAGSHRKRELLFRAFYMRFDPELYKEGMGKLLWDITCALEYPTLRALRELIDEEKAAIERRAKLISPNPLALFIKKNDMRWPHIAQLEVRGLIWVREHLPDMEGIRISKLGHALSRFALEEYWEPFASSNTDVAVRNTIGEGD